ncbi:MAG: hypothetical protein NC191_01935 [Muribaculaceae bacterium]|nr:hypothetical protein [Muribaculaceae bacterium]
MRIDGLTPNYGVTKNGNPYKKSEMGKRLGRDAGLAYIAYATYKGVKNGMLAEVAAPSVEALGNLSKFFAKNPSVAKWGMIGAGVALAAVVVGGIGKLVGHCVDKVVEAKRKKAADKAAAAE